MGRKVLGVEITTRLIKTAIVKNDSKPELLYCNIMDTPVSFSSNGVLSEDENDIARLALLIKESIPENKQLIKGLDSLAICVSNSQTVVRPITLPALPDKDLKAAVEYELSQTFPGVSKTHVISFKIYSRENKTLTGIVSFSPRKTLEAYKKLVDALGYRYSYIDVVANSEAKAFSAFTDLGTADKTYCLCDIGFDSTKFTIVNKGRVLHSRQIPEGDNIIKNMVCSKLGINDSEYYAFRKSSFSDESFDISEADLFSMAQLMYGNILEQLHQTIEFYSNSNIQAPVSEIVLVGGGSIFPKLEEYFSSVLNLPSGFIAPFNNIKTDQLTFIRTLPAIGAAVRGD